MGNIIVRQQVAFGNKNSESMRWGELIDAEHRRTAPTGKMRLDTMSGIATRTS